MTKTKFQQKVKELFLNPELLASQLEELEKFHEEEKKEERIKMWEKIRTDFLLQFKSKSIQGMIKSCYHDHRGMDRNLLIPSMADRIWGSLRGGVLLIIDRSKEDHDQGQIENKVGIEHREETKV